MGGYGRGGYGHGGYGGYMGGYGGGGYGRGYGGHGGSYGGHGHAVNLASGLAETVTQWQLERNGKGPAVTTDNVSNIVRAVKESSLGPHMGCFANTINLATQRGRKVQQVHRVLGRLRRVVTYVHKSTSVTSCLKLMQTKLDIAQHKLLLDVPTR
ncbi:hypothetical protein MAR_014845 [Mya arenaria]|uniref:Peroxin-13 n=1 Tax=Mya arenaria TaxID=6604 RepID=A0ABY7FJF1_MYAAR|nr:hypothetical protein MAR_014845 [Mya arenaria]